MPARDRDRPPALTPSRRVDSQTSTRDTFLGVLSGRPLDLATPVHGRAIERAGDSGAILPGETVTVDGMVRIIHPEDGLFSVYSPDTDRRLGYRSDPTEAPAGAANGVLASTGNEVAAGAATEVAAGTGNDDTVSTDEEDAKLNWVQTKQ